MNERVSPSPIPFIDLAAQRRRIGAALDQALARVLDHGQFILGPEVRVFEAQLASFCGVPHAVSCASGTDALMMLLMAKNIGAGDAVICPSFTFTATAGVVALVGATPVFADVEELTFNLDADTLARACATARKHGLRPKAVIPVDLFGHPANHNAIASVAQAEKLFVLDDAAQAFGATYRKTRLGAVAPATATSFFPSKPLGCYGDGGAELTHDEELANVMRSLRMHGQGSHKYDCVRIGLNGRLDTMQAAVLIEKLKIFEEEIAARQRIAARYSKALADVVTVPAVAPDCSSAWAQYTIRESSGQRDTVAAMLAGQGIPTAVHYPAPLHRQPAFRNYPVAEGGAPVSERLASEVLSLPMHPYLDEMTQDRITAAVRSASHTL
jgi:dTDP-4-amino-4,6-dideoxygalactose transaminase